MISPLRLFVVLAAGLTGAAIAQTEAAQEPAEDQQPPPVFRVRTDLVVIDLIATAKGEPVLDLQADEIEVKQDGKKIPVQFFQAIDLDRELIQKSDGSDSPLPMPEAAQFVILIDLGNLGIETRRFVVPAIRQVLGNQLAFRDRVMLASMGRAGLKVHLPFTNSIPEVIGVAERVLAGQDGMGRAEGSADGFGNERADSRRFITAERLPNFGDDQPNPIRYQTTTEAHNVRADEVNAALKSAEISMNQEALTRMVTDAARSLELLSRYLQRLPGRKNVVYISDGYQLHQEGDSTINRMPAYMQDKLRPAIQAANRAQTAFYTVDARGVGADDSQRPFHTALARETGGVAIFGSNDLTKGFERAYEESKRYYRLAYAPPSEPEPGKSHKITVRSNRKGVELRYRTEYVEPDPEELRKADILNAIAFPELFREFALEVQPQVRDGRPTLHVRIPKDQIWFRQAGTVRTAEIAFFAQVTEANGTLLQEDLHLSMKYPLRFDEQQFASLGVLTADHTLSVDLKPGRYRLTVAVHQPWFELISAYTAILTVP